MFVVAVYFGWLACLFGWMIWLGVVLVLVSDVFVVIVI